MKKLLLKDPWRWLIIPAPFLLAILFECILMVLMNARYLLPSDLELSVWYVLTSVIAGGASGALMVWIISNLQDDRKPYARQRQLEARNTTSIFRLIYLGILVLPYLLYYYLGTLSLSLHTSAYTSRFSRVLPMKQQALDMLPVMSLWMGVLLAFAVWFVKWLRSHTQEKRAREPSPRDSIWFQ